MSEAITPSAPLRNRIALDLEASPGEAVRWVRERQHYALVDEAPVDDAAGARVFTYRVEALSEIAHWARAWGAEVTVLSPPELRQSLREEASRLVATLA